MGSEDRDSRSVSHDRDLDDSDAESTLQDGKEGGAAGKPGRKKNPNSAAARRDQNRIAQREFRLRKQQRIRDLEARVEILSGTKEETVSELRNMMKDLMAENAQLRNLIRSLGGYIGDGLGGVLPSMGFDRPQDFVDYLNKAETDTAFESFQKRKKATQTMQNSPNPLSTDLGKKRSLDEGLLASNKRAKPDHQQNGSTAYSPLLPGPSSTGSNYTSSTPRNNSIGPNGFSDLLSGSGSSMYMTGPGTNSPNHYPSPPTQYPPVFHPPLAVPSGMNAPQSYMSPPPAPTATSMASSGPSPPIAAPEDDEKTFDDPKLHEATKLIHYHLDNYKRNNAYCLPQSLRPTLVQRTVPHESVIDGIIHPELRDRMILLRGRFDLVECLHMLVKNITLHGDDVLAHANWEIGETWLRHFGYLVDQPVLNICNKWRRDKGESELQMSDIAIAQPDIPTGQ